jgi:tryptophan synthase beta subunit
MKRKAQNWEIGSYMGEFTGRLVCETMASNVENLVSFDYKFISLQPKFADELCYPD